MLKIGIVGAGGIARSHVTALRSLAGIQLSTIHDIDRSAAIELASTCGADVSESLDDLIAACDAVFVCAWTGAHRDIVQAVVSAGRAVFCEKPLAPTLADARRMADAVAAAGVVNQVGLPLRWVPGFAVLRDLLTDPATGSVLSVSLHTQMAVRKMALAGWRRDVTRAGGGVLLEVGFHDIDLMEWLAGPVTALGVTTCPGRYPGIEDAASVSMKFASGAVGALVTTWHEAPAPHSARRLHVVCERAQYLLDGDTLTVSGPGERNLVFNAADLVGAAHQRALSTSPHEAFVGAVLSKARATPDFSAAIRVHELLDAAYRSASDHATVEV